MKSPTRMSRKASEAIGRALLHRMELPTHQVSQILMAITMELREQEIMLTARRVEAIRLQS